MIYSSSFTCIVQSEGVGVGAGVEVLEGAHGDIRRVGHLRPLEKLNLELSYLENCVQTLLCSDV